MTDRERKIEEFKIHNRKIHNRRSYGPRIGIGHLIHLLTRESSLSTPLQTTAVDRHPPWRPLCTRTPHRPSPPTSPPPPTKPRCHSSPMPWPIATTPPKPPSRPPRDPPSRSPPHPNNPRSSDHHSHPFPRTNPQCDPVGRSRCCSTRRCAHSHRPRRTLAPHSRRPSHMAYTSPQSRCTPYSPCSSRYGSARRTYYQGSARTPQSPHRTKCTLPNNTKAHRRTDSSPSTTYTANSNRNPNPNHRHLWRGSAPA